jgi:phospholipase C
MAGLEHIEHVVVLMLENRSFDNVLGWLYDPANPAPFNREPPANFEGLSGKDFSNPGPKGIVPAANRPETHRSLPRPRRSLRRRLNKTPPPPPGAPNMQGFVNNHARKNLQIPEIIVNCFTPETLPVLSGVAYYYGVCNHWFCSIPSQTICNRSFAQAGTSSGYVDNQGPGFIFVNKTQTIYNRLSAAGKSWRVYTAGLDGDQPRTADARTSMGLRCQTGIFQAAT